MTFEGIQLQGSKNIMEKLNVSGLFYNISFSVEVCFHIMNLIGISSLFILQGLSFQKINRLITAVDSQPMFDGGVLINVLGRLQVCDFLDQLSTFYC